MGTHMGRQIWGEIWDRNLGRVASNLRTVFVFLNLKLIIPVKEVCRVGCRLRQEAAG